MEGERRGKEEGERGRTLRALQRRQVKDAVTDELEVSQRRQERDGLDEVLLDRVERRCPQAHAAHPPCQVGPSTTLALERCEAVVAAHMSQLPQQRLRDRSQGAAGEARRVEELAISSDVASRRGKACGGELDDADDELEGDPLGGRGHLDGRSGLRGSGGWVGADRRGCRSPPCVTTTQVDAVPRQCRSSTRKAGCRAMTSWRERRDEGGRGEGGRDKGQRGGQQPWWMCAPRSKSERTGCDADVASERGGERGRGNVRGPRPA